MNDARARTPALTLQLLQVSSP